MSQADEASHKETESDAPLEESGTLIAV